MDKKSTLSKPQKNFQYFTEAVLEKGYHQIGKMRCDTNLRYLYTGEQKTKGRHKIYDGKWILGDTRRLEFIEKTTGF